MTSAVFGIVRICCSVFKHNYRKNEKPFLNFLFIYWNFHQNLIFFLKRIIVIADVFPKLQIVKNVVRSLSKKCQFGTSLESQHLKVSQTLVKSGWEHFHQIFSSLWEGMIRKISPLLKIEILGVFDNTLTTDDKYHVRDCENLLFPN